MTLVIPGLPESMTHQRWEWEDEYRVASWVRADGMHYICPSLNISFVDGNIVHYPGSNSPTLRSNTDALAIAHWRAIQRHYVESRGYSVGYQIGVDERGHAWELRGFDFKSAATLGHNDHTVAGYFIIGSQQRPSDAAIRTACLIHAETARLAGRALIKWNWDVGFWISGHNAARQHPRHLGAGTVTACCGAPTYELLDTMPVGDGGKMHPRELVAPPPPPPPPPGELEVSEATDLLREIVTAQKATTAAVVKSNTEMESMDNRLYQLNQRMVVGLNLARSENRRWVILLDLLRGKAVSDAQMNALLADIAEDQAAVEALLVEISEDVGTAADAQVRITDAIVGPADEPTG